MRERGGVQLLLGGLENENAVGNFCTLVGVVFCSRFLPVQLRVLEGGLFWGEGKFDSSALEDFNPDVVYRLGLVWLGRG